MLGARIPLGGVATVASLPERRREGYVGALLRGALTRDEGGRASGLRALHAALLPLPEIWVGDREPHGELCVRAEGYADARCRGRGVAIGA